jgi:hypothetical protein
MVESTSRSFMATTTNNRRGRLYVPIMTGYSHYLLGTIMPLVSVGLWT